MTRHCLIVWPLLLLCLGCAGPAALPRHTHGDIALDNLDHLAERHADDPAALDLLLLRAHLRGDVLALDRVVALTEPQTGTADALLRRAKGRAAVHRFADALADLDAAQRAGADPSQVQAQRAAVLVATGRAGEVLPWLQAEAARRPGFASHTTLARAQASLGRFAEADALYAAALRELDTPSPFPAAAIWFARGKMWAEQAGDARRGESAYRQALALVPGYVVANVHLAELELARGDLAAAIERLERVAPGSHDPEPLGLLGHAHVQAGQVAQGRVEIEAARRRYEALLQRHPAAFAGHAAELAARDTLSRPPP